MTVFYFLSCLLYLISLAFADFPAAWLLKVLPLSLLIFLVLRSSILLRQRWLLMIALVASAIGDILLEKDHFIAGLAAFLFAQITYAILFAGFWQSTKQRICAVSALLAYACGMGYLLQPVLNDLLMPVIAYLCVITTMGILALQSRLPTLLAPVGALIFIASDSLIAVDKFLMPMPMRDYSVMITYYLAQWMIVTGLMRANR